MTASLDTGLSCFILLAKYLRVPADPEQLRHHLGKGGEHVSPADILRLAKTLEIKAKHKKVPVVKLS